MSDALVSCIIPCYNGARYLGECVGSILAQGHRPLEVIVVDDGSTDDPAEVVRSFGNEVRYHRRENGGPGAACNTGLALARGAFVAFLEQDDLWVPGKLERQLAELARDPQLDYCVSHIQNFWVAELAAEDRRHQHLPVMQPVPGYVVQTLLSRRRTFDTVGCFDEALRFACATDWFMRADEAGARGLLLPDVLTRRRLHPGNFSRLNRDQSREQFLHVVKSMLDRRRKAGLLDVAG
jgi:glycosyltransferase involved in cell wall biosynthesis